MSGSKKNDQTSHREMRVTSVQKIINALRKGIYTKNGIMKETNLSWGSCSSIINLLYEKKLVIKTGNKTGKGRGRKTSEFLFNDKKNLLFGMEIREDGILCSIINWGEHEIFRHTYSFKDPITQAELTQQAASAYINSLVDAGIKPGAITGLSIALAGRLDVENKKWLFAPRIKSINNYDFTRLFKILPDIPYFFIEHDIHAQASSVIRQRKWNDSDYVFLHIGRGISMSIYNNGLYMGNRGFAGEIGHIPYPLNNEEGEVQTVESAVSEKGIINYIEKKYGIILNDLAEMPDDLKREESLLEHVYNAIKYIIIVTTNILDPKTIIIGGSVLEPFYPMLNERIGKEVRNYTWAGGPQNIKWYKHGEMYGAFGTILNASDKIINAVIEEELV